MLKLRTFVSFAFCHGRTEWLLVISLNAGGKVEFDAAFVRVNLVGVLVVSDDFVGDDDRPCEFEICHIGRNNASRESLESFPLVDTLMSQLWSME